MLNSKDHKILYIDYKNYEIHHEIPQGIEFIDWFSCDASIAEIIADLNKKGYITASNSCGGHLPIIQGPFIRNFDTIKRGPYIAFQENIVLPNIPKGFYKIPMRVGESYKNCLVSSIEELLPMDTINIFPTEKIIDQCPQTLPHIDNSGYIHLKSEKDVLNFYEYYSLLLEKTRLSLTEWVKALPLQQDFKKAKI